MFSLLTNSTRTCCRSSLCRYLQMRHGVIQRTSFHSTACWRLPQQTEDKDQPIKFSTSRAAQRSTAETFKVPERDVPSYQPVVILISLGVFLIYFLVLREENDLDEELNTSLYERLPGLEKTQINLSIDYNKKHGLQTEDLEKRLSEIEQSDSAKNMA